MKRTLGRFFPGAILLALVSILSPTNAYAGVLAKASNSTAQSISTVTFKVAPGTFPAFANTGITQNIPNTAITLSATSNNFDGYAFFNNTGTIAVTSFSWTFLRTAGNGVDSFDYCPVNNTFISATNCTNSFLPSTMALTGVQFAVPAGQLVAIHFNFKKSTDVYTMSSTVSRSQIRSGTNTTA